MENIFTVQVQLVSEQEQTTSKQDLDVALSYSWETLVVQKDNKN